MIVDTFVVLDVDDCSWEMRAFEVVVEGDREVVEEFEVTGSGMTVAVLVDVTDRLVAPEDVPPTVELCV